MAINNVSELSTTAASNTDLAGTSILGSGLVSTADDSFRNVGSFLAKWWSDLGGVNTVGGTGDAITVTTPTVYTALKTGMRFQFIASAANTTAVTLNFDAIGAKAVRKIVGGVDVALAAGDIPGAKYRVDVVYDATANAAAGAWIVISVDLSSYLKTTTAAATYLQLAGGTLTGALNFAPTQTIASATTTDIGAATSNSVIVSGTTTITGLGTVAAGVTRDVLFSGALTLTHSGTALILPTAANITTAANDNATFRSLGAGNWVCLNYERANGAPIIAAGTSGNLLTSDGTNWASTAPAAAGGMTLLGTLTTTSGTTQSLTGIAAGYRQLYCEFEGVSFSSGVVMTLALSSTNGAAYGTAVNIAPSTVAGAGTAEGEVTVFGVSNTGQNQTLQALATGNGTFGAATGAIATNTGAVVNAIRFAGGTFDAGTIRIYGVK